MRAGSTLQVLRVCAFALLTASCAQAVPQQGTSPAEIFRRVRSSVVVLVAVDAKGEQIVQGSGFIVGPNLIATNHHVLSDTSGAYAVFADGQTEEVTGVVADSEAKDLLVVAVNTGKRPALQLGDELNLREGDRILALGAPRGLELSLTDGIVSSFRTVDEQFLIQATAPIAPGSSGGPLFDMKGRVVGITTSALSHSPGIYFSVGVSDLKRLLRSPQHVLTPGDWHKTAQGVLSNIQQLVDQHKYREAKIAFESVPIAARIDAAVLRLLAVTDYATGDRETAESIANTILRRDPTDELALKIIVGTAFWNRPKNPDLWRQRLIRLEAINPGAGWVLMAKAMDDFRAEKSDDALAKIQAAKKDSFPDAAPFSSLAAYYIARRQLAEAGKEINDGLAAFPDNSQLLSQQMFLSLMLHNFADARRSYSRLQELPEPSFEASFHSCLYYYAIDQPSAARSYCAEAANHEPDNATAQANYGWVALDLGDFSVANQQFRKAWGLLTRPSARVGQTQEVDLIWGLILSAYFTGNKSAAREMFQLLRGGGTRLDHG
jgi:S1-C subfamily serine protease